MPIAPNLRGVLNAAPYESQRAQKLNKEKKKVPTHTPVGYRLIFPQVTYFQQDRPKHRDEIRSAQETELHRSRCNPGVFRPKMLCIFLVNTPTLPPPPYKYGNESKLGWDVGWDVGVGSTGTPSDSVLPEGGAKIAQVGVCRKAGDALGNRTQRKGRPVGPPESLSRSNPLAGTV